jgi:Uma2 family endonuclease
MSDPAHTLTDPAHLPLADFLDWEAAQEIRHERVGGTVWAMTGGTLNHNRIAANAWSALRERLKGSGCEAFLLDVRVITPRGDVLYPDVVVACGPRRGGEREIADPVVVIEVLSPSTTARDHGIKRWAYGTIPGLRHYVLVAQDRAEAEVASAAGEVWESVHLRDPGALVRLDALGVEIPMGELLAGVDFGPGAAERGSDSLARS